MASRSSGFYNTCGSPGFLAPATETAGGAIETANDDSMILGVDLGSIGEGGGKNIMGGNLGELSLAPYRRDETLLRKIQACRICESFLPNPPRPLALFSDTARIVLLGQAPGRRAHESNKAWDDPSGQRLRAWLGIDDDVFYDRSLVAFLPMGFCFPGTGKSGDLPPRKECAPQWHEQVFAELPNARLTILIGGYAQKAYLPAEAGMNIEQRIRYTMDKADTGDVCDLFALPHPSWRVNGWMKRNPWFEVETLPLFQAQVARVLS